MTATPTGRLSRDSLAAAKGVIKLLRFDPTWVKAFDLSRLGFVRSFFAQILALPLVLLFFVLTTRADGGDVTRNLLFQTGLSDGIDVIVYPILVLVAARLLKLKNWTAFITVLNWGDLVFATLFAMVSGLTIAGDVGLAAVRIVWLVVLAPLQILFAWRAARETMGTDISVTVLLVVLELALSVGSDQLAALILPA